MTDSLGDLLKHQQRPEPAEFVVIKDYVLKEYDSIVNVSLLNNQLVITAPNAALAGTLRLNMLTLQEITNWPDRLIIRIG